MAKYFTISQGLRGCYMHDSSYTIRCETRRELKSALESEAYYIRDAGFVGLSKKAVTALAAAAWRETGKGMKKSFYPHVAGYGYRGNAHSGLFVNHSDRQEYLECKRKWLTGN